MFSLTVATSTPKLSTVRDTYTASDIDEEASTAMHGTDIDSEFNVLVSSSNEHRVRFRVRG